MPRNINDQAVQIPSDLFSQARIDWEKSELSSQGLSFSGVKILENKDENIENSENKFGKQNIKSQRNENITDYDPEEFIDEKLAAKFLGLSPRTLQGFRTKGDGPEFHKIGKKSVRYQIADLQNWKNNARRRNTSR